jgi:DNA-binding transcriptional ArsR family regulator
LKEEENADLVSEKIFNRRLEALCKEDNQTVTKIVNGVDADGKEITDRTPRYSITEYQVREELREFYYTEFAENISDRLESIEQNLPKLKDDELVLQLFYFYSVLNRLSLIWRIRLEKVGPSRKMTKYIEYTIPLKLKQLSSIVNKLPEERKKNMFENLMRKAVNDNSQNNLRMRLDIEAEIGTECFRLPEWDVLDRKRWDSANPGKDLRSRFTADKAREIQLKYTLSKVNAVRSPRRKIKSKKVKK